MEECRDEEDLDPIHLKIESISNDGLVLAYRSDSIIRVLSLKDRIENEKTDIEKCITEFDLNHELSHFSSDDASTEFIKELSHQNKKPELSLQT